MSKAYDSDKIPEKEIEVECNECPWKGLLTERDQNVCDADDGDWDEYYTCPECGSENLYIF